MITVAVLIVLAINVIYIAAIIAAIINNGAPRKIRPSTRRANQIQNS